MTIDPSATVHPTAVVANGAQVGPDCRIGAFCVVDENVVLGSDVTLKSHVVVTGSTRVGDGTVIFPFASIGEIPQDLKFAGEETRLEIGARCRIREGVTMNTGTEGGGGLTKVGNDGLFMANSHVAHDCVVGDRVIMANNSCLAGHCVVSDDVIIGGLSGVHQFVRIGRGAIIGAVTMVTNDVIPHGLVQGPRGVLDGLNLVGLKRKGVPRDDITALRAAYQTLAQGDGTFQDRARHLSDDAESDYVREVADFVLSASDRPFLTPD